MYLSMLNYHLLLFDFQRPNAVCVSEVSFFLAATCISYHKLFCLSTPFFDFFQVFFVSLFSRVLTQVPLLHLVFLPSVDFCLRYLSPLYSRDFHIITLSLLCPYFLLNFFTPLNLSGRFGVSFFHTEQ